MSDIIYTPPASGGGGQNPGTNFIPLNDGTSSFIDSNFYNVKNDRIESFFNGFLFGLDIDYFNNETKIGDYNYVFSGNCLEIYNFNIWTKYQGNINGLWCNFFNRTYRLGEISGLYVGTYLSIDDNNEFISSYHGGHEIGLKLDFKNEQYILGDFNAINNGNYIIVDNPADEVVICANTQLNIKGANIQVNNIYTYSTENLQIKAPDGNIYYIPLYK